MITNERIKTDLKTKDFWYDLPEELIAQHPSEVRDMARLMTVDRKTGGIGHHIFHDIVDMLNPGDVMVINDSKVIPARLYGTKVSEGHAHVEVVLLRQRSLDHWEALVNPGRRLKPGTSIVFGENENGEPLLTAEITEILEGGNRMLEFSYDHSKYTIYDILDKIGNMPLPPYITEKLEDKSRYQTVYAREEGSAAAPTAGLHFTPELLDRIREKGVAIAPVMLHVGLGTFRPVKEDAIGDHLMHSEFFSVTEESARVINERRAAGGRIVAVGTTSCRTLESASDDNGIGASPWTRMSMFAHGSDKVSATSNIHLRATSPTKAPETVHLRFPVFFYTIHHILFNLIIYNSPRL